jgi:pyruvate dehydrogenase E1 component alpha subunit
MGTSVERASAMTEYYKRGQYIPGLRIDGMDVLAVMAAVKYGKEYCVAQEKGPLVYEYQTYRYAGHSMSDPGISYRTRDEVRQTRTHDDPINNLKHKMIEWKIASEEELKRIDKEARSQVDKDVQEAEEMPEPDPNAPTLFADIYVRGSEPDYLRGRTPDETYYYR